MKNAGKPRILYLLKILFEETDSEHGMTLPEIQARLEDYEITCERKSLYRDFDALDAFGIKLEKMRTRPVRYCLSERLFEPAQMMLLVDAVQTSRSITRRNSSAIVKKLKRLVSREEAKQLEARVHVAGRVKMQNESIFHTVDCIQQALSEKRDISFNYMQYDVHKNLNDVSAHDSKDRIRTPLYLVYSNDNYYLLTYDENDRQHIRNYRVDRMHNVMIRDKSPKGHKLEPGFDVAEYERLNLGMFGGKPQAIKLQVAEGVVGSVIDIFGAENVECSPASKVQELRGDTQNSDRAWASMRIKATPSQVFFGKVAQFGGDVRIVYPKKVVCAYEEHLDRLMQAQKLAAKK